ncbi:hypothetical protein QMM95_09880 [Leptospira santarosai]|uniref:hypothetical protein n=1 Tax=Leptospira santarosai TaxID=28183 RepID=UPI0024AF95D5|nr:hypothetical protein [Leptospira santarosai]MDI7236395.1 hypothetical protein [Leptospira santarosai]
MSTKFDNKIKKIKEHLSSYNPEEVLYYSFSLFLWIPNISAIAKSELTYAIFLALPINLFNEEKVPDFSYERFSYFCRKLIGLFPDFRTLEDFIPETDWGEIKYFLNKKYYKIFYGGNFSNPHDYIKLFEILHFPFAEFYEKKEGIRPQNALQEVLQLIDNIIDEIDQKNIDALNVSPGHLEVPSNAFWNSCKDYLDNFQNKISGNQYLVKEAIWIGGQKGDILEEDKFYEVLFSESIVRKYLIEHNGKCFPFLPRNYIHNLFNNWGQKFPSSTELNIAEVEDAIMHAVGSFADSALENVQILPFVEIEGINVSFQIGISQSDKLILIYIGNIYNALAVEEGLSNLNLNSINPLKIKVMGHESKFGFRNKSGEYEVDEESRIKVELIYLSLGLNTFAKSVKLPTGFTANFWFSLDFIGILYSLDSLEQLFKFLEFKRIEKNKIFGHSLSHIDYFGAFVDSSGIIDKGASDPDTIFLDPLWGSKFRYRFLKNFYLLFPQSPLLGDPYGWKLRSSSANEIVTITKKNAKVICLSTNKSKISTILFINDNDLDLENFKILHLLGECLIYNINKYSNEITKSNIPQFKNEIIIHLVPKEMQKTWRFAKHKYSEQLILEADVKKISDSFLNLENRSKENELLLSFLYFIAGEHYIFDSEIYKKLKEDELLPPGFKTFDLKLEYDRSNNLLPAELSDYEFFYAQKIIAEHCKKLDIVPGIYTGKAAKTILNAIRSSLISLIESRILSCNYRNTIVSLIVEGEAQYIKFKDLEAKIIKAKNQMVDYNRLKVFREERNEFLELHSSFRYLLAKFVSLVPSEESVLTKDELLQLIGISKGILHLYRVSDNLHYTIITEYEIEISDDFILRSNLPEEITKKLSNFQDKIADGKINRFDKVFKSSGTFIQDQKFNHELDIAFLSDFGFSANDFLSCLDILRYLPSSMSIDYDGCVRLPKSKIIEHVSRKLEINILTVEKVIDFLTLKTSEVLTVLDENGGGKKGVPDIPVWEYAKRYSRPEIRPIIEIDEILYFGTTAVYTSLLIWAGCINRFYFPFALPSSNVEKVLNKVEKSFQDHLVVVAFNIVREFTMKLAKELDIPDLIPGAETIGDVDILAILEEKKIILNIECKYIRDTFAAKDSRRVRDKIFKSSSKEKNYLEKVERRHQELNMNKNVVLSYFKISLERLTDYKVVSLFITSMSPSITPVGNVR